MRMRTATGLALAVIWLAIPASAHAATWIEGTVARPFGLADAGGLIVLGDTDGNPSLTPPWQATKLYGTTSSFKFEPRSVRLDPLDGSLLVSNGNSGGWVTRIYSDGSSRRYTSADVPGLFGRSFDAYPLEDGGMLVVDRNLAAVVKLDKNLHEVFRISKASGQVDDPFAVEPVGTGQSRTLVADSLGNKVVEVDNATGNVIWSFGQAGSASAGKISKPHSAQRLPNGNTLICASGATANSGKVIEVSPAGSIVWTYGIGQLNNPNSALRVANGDTLVCDTDNKRVVEVDFAGRTVRGYGTDGLTPAGSLIEPRAILRRADGSTLIADLQSGDASLPGQLLSFVLRPTYTAVSGAIDPQLGALKTFSRIEATSTIPTGTAIALDYKLNNGAWVAAPPDGSIPPSPGGSSTISYRVRMTTSGGVAAPTLDEVRITWDIFTPTSGGGSNTTTTPPPVSTTPTTTTTTTTKKTTTTTGATKSVGTGSGSGTSFALPPFGMGAPGSSPGQTGAVASGGATKISGWVMSEVSASDAGWGGLAPASRGPNGQTLGNAAVPTAAFLLVAYSFGLAWSPAARLAGHLISLVTAAH